MKPEDYRNVMDRLNDAVVHLRNGGKLILVLPPGDTTGVLSVIRARLSDFWSQIRFEKLKTKT